MLYVNVKSDSRSGTRRYGIVEDASGELWWSEDLELVAKTEPSLAGLEPWLAGTSLTRNHAEEITGLYCPAAWDRVREMVQDSGVWRLPEEK